MLRRDPTGRPVLHQADVVDVGNLRASDALVDPAHDVAEDALRVVVELGLRSRPRSSPSSGASGIAQQVVERGPWSVVASRSASSCWRARRRRGGSGWRAAWRPSATAPTRSWRRRGDGRSSGRACRPSGRAPPTCPCRSGPGRAARRRGRCRRSSPRTPGSTAALSSSLLRTIGPASIEVWISSPVRSRKPVLMNATRGLGGADALGEVERGAPLLVHDADLDRVRGQPSTASTAAEHARRRTRPRPGRASSA